MSKYMHVPLEVIINDGLQRNSLPTLSEVEPFVDRVVIGDGVLRNIKTRTAIEAADRVHYLALETFKFKKGFTLCNNYTVAYLSDSSEIDELDDLYAGKATESGDIGGFGYQRGYDLFSKIGNYVHVESNSDSGVLTSNNSIIQFSAGIETVYLLLPRSFSRGNGNPFKAGDLVLVPYLDRKKSASTNTCIPVVDATESGKEFAIRMYSKEFKVKSVSSKLNTLCVHTPEGDLDIHYSLVTKKLNLIPYVT